MKQERQVCNGGLFHSAQSEAPFFRAEMSSIDESQERGQGWGYWLLLIKTLIYDNPSWDGSQVAFYEY